MVALALLLRAFGLRMQTMMVVPFLVWLAATINGAELPLQPAYLLLYLPLGSLWLLLAVFISRRLRQEAGTN